MWGRPNLHTSYQSETSIFPTWTQRLLITLLALLAVLLPFDLPVINQIPVVSYLGDDDWIRLTTQAVIFVVAALGLNLLTGVSGQVSLGHAFFMGVGAYTAAYLGGESGSRHVGPRAADVDLATGRRHLRRADRSPHRARRGPCARAVPRHRHRRAGLHRHPPLPPPPRDLGASRGRTQLPAARAEVLEGGRAVHLLHRGRPLAVVRHQRQRQDVPVLPRLDDRRAVVVAKNLVRSRTGRALQAIRDRDVAAEIMGVPEVKYKLIGVRPVVVLRRRRRGACSPRSSGACHPSTGTSSCPSSSSPSCSSAAPARSPARSLGTFFVVLLPRFMEEFAQLDDRAGRRIGTVGLVLGRSRQQGPERLRVRLLGRDRPGLPGAGERPRHDPLRRSWSSSSCCSSRSACTASGSRSATTGRAGRSRTDAAGSQRAIDNQHTHKGGTMRRKWRSSPSRPAWA